MFCLHICVCIMCVWGCQILLMAVSHHVEARERAPVPSKKSNSPKTTESLSGSSKSL